MMNYKEDIVVIKAQLIPIIGMLSEDDSYTKERAVIDLKNILRLLDETEPKL